MSRTVLITGANRGVGLEAASQLARVEGIRLILACRNVQLGEQAAQDIKSKTGNESLVVLQLDLASLESVRELAKHVLDNESRLDGLVCNAGAHFKAKQLTVDGIESTFSANFLGHFHLTLLLLPLLRKSVPSRVVVTTSMAYLFGHVDFGNLNCEKSFGTVSTYSNAKLCCLLFVKELQHRLTGSGVTVVAYNPGTLSTDIYHDLPRWFNLMTRLWPPMWSTVHQSGQDTARLAIYERPDTVNPIRGGQLYSKRCGILSVTPYGADKRVAKKLWDASQAMCEQRINGVHILAKHSQ